MVSITVQLNFDYALSFRFFLLWQPLVETGARSQLGKIWLVIKAKLFPKPRRHPN